MRSKNTGSAVSGKTMSFACALSASRAYASKIAGARSGLNFISCSTLPCTSAALNGSPARSVHSTWRSASPPPRTSTTGMRNSALRCKMSQSIPAADTVRNESA